MDKNTVGVVTRGRMKKDLNDLSRFSYSHFLPFIVRIHSHNIMASITKKGKRKKEREEDEPEARVSEPFAKGGVVIFCGF